MNMWVITSTLSTCKSCARAYRHGKGWIKYKEWSYFKSLRFYITKLGFRYWKRGERDWENHTINAHAHSFVQRENTVLSEYKIGPLRKCRLCVCKKGKKGNVMEWNEKAVLMRWNMSCRYLNFKACCTALHYVFEIRKWGSFAPVVYNLSRTL